MIERDKIIHKIRLATKKRIPSRRTRKRACLWYAYETFRILNGNGVRCLIQAGSASWKIVPDELDDGVSPNCYSYVCSIKSPKLANVFDCGLLPEMHAWAAIPETNEVIDLTTCYIPEKSKDAGRTCKVDQPDYVWEDVKKLAKQGMYYRPTEAATKLAMHLILGEL